MGQNPQFQRGLRDNEMKFFFEKKFSKKEKKFLKKKFFFQKKKKNKKKWNFFSKKIGIFFQKKNGNFFKKCPRQRKVDGKWLGNALLIRAIFTSEENIFQI